MRYARLGSTGLVVSRMALGTMTFGSGDGPMGAIWKIDQAAADRLVAQSLDRGVNFFDSADAYAGGQSEEMLGRALGKRRGEVVISTKIGFRTGEALVAAGLSYRRIIEAVEACLRRLGTDYIDVMSFHTLDPFTPVDESLRGLEEVVRRGWVRYVGYSNYPSWLAATILERQRARGFSPMVAAQMYYSLLGRDLEIEHVPFALENGIGLVIWSPLAGGFLSGRYTRENPGGDGGRLAAFDFIPMDKARAYDVVEGLREMAAARGVSVAQLSLAWLLTRPAVSSVLVGASRPEQLEENLKAAELDLSDDELQRMDAMAPPVSTYPHWYNTQIGADAAVGKALG